MALINQFNLRQDCNLSFSLNSVSRSEDFVKVALELLLNSTDVLLVGW